MASLQQTTSCPSRAIANLAALRATGNTPKTVPRLCNALKPFSSQLVLLSPTVVLKSLRGATNESPPGDSTGSPPQAMSVVPREINPRGDGHNSSGLSLQYLDRESLEVDGKQMDLLTSLLALVKARNRNAIVVHVGDEAMAPVLEQIQKDLSFPSCVANKVKFKSYLTHKCISDVVELDPNEVVAQLRELGLFSAEVSGKLTYSPSLFELPVHTPLGAKPKKTGKRGGAKASQELGEKGPFPSISNVSMEVETATDSITEASVTCRLQNDPVLLAAVKSIRKWDRECLPRTEPKLANALRTSMPCRVIQVCKPTEVLKRLGKEYVDSTFCRVNVPQVKSFEVSLPGLFGEQEPPRKVDHLVKFQKQLLAKVHRTNSSLEYIRQASEEDELVQVTVKQVQEWVGQKQCEFHKAMDTMTAPTSDGLEPMETATQPDSAQGPSRPRPHFPTKASLVSELLQLCVTHIHLDPTDMVRLLEAQSIIEISEDGSVVYTNISEPLPSRAEVVRQCVELERAAIQQVVGIQASSPPKGNKRKIQKQGRRVYKRLHLT